MIARYQRQVMADLWSDSTKFATYLNIELLNVEALVVEGVATKEEYVTLQRKAKFDLARIAELEAETKHDVIAFTRNISESLGPEKRFIHYGLTSTDVVDTANGCLLKAANAVILADIDHFMSVLKNKSQTYKKTYCIGRTHGIHAEITTFGLKWALWYDEMVRNRERFLQAAQGVEVGKISGAVGNYAFTNPKIETYLCERLGLAKPHISTQTLQRDRHAHYIEIIALIGATMEKIATEIRHLMRTEVGEVREYFAPSQKGSSAMPHKQNPISSENICGLSRILRGYVIPALDDVALWHERDISHSSVERILLPDATSLIDYMLVRYANVLDELVVDEARMLSNISLTNGVVFSQRVLTLLLDKGVSRELAYDHIQSLSKIALDLHLAFGSLCEQDPWLKSMLNSSEIASAFTLNHYLKSVDYIYSQVFGGTSDDKTL